MKNTATDLLENSEKVKQIIVQCPKCQTKFTIDAKLIEGQNSLKFHCSRCDNLFITDEFVTPNIIKETNDEEDNKEVSFKNATHEIAHKKDPTFISFDVFSNTKEEEDFDGLDVQDNLAIEKKEFTNDFKSIEDLRTRKITSTFSRQKGTSNLSGRFAPYLKQKTDWTQFSYIVLPLVTALIIIAATAITFSNDTKSANIFNDLFSTSTTNTIPAGLYIKNTSQKLLQSKDEANIFIISGTIENDTTQTFKDARTEGLIFNQNGEVLNSSQALASAALSDVDITTSDINDIIAKQNKRTKQRFKIAPGEKYDFQVAVPNVPGQKPIFYSVRIYSTL